MDHQKAFPADSTKAAWDRGEYQAVATAVLESYGVEIRSFLLARFHDEFTADEVYSDFTIDLWRGLPKFRWACTIRAWCYTLARNAANRFRRSPHNRRDHRISMSEAPFLEQLIQRTRSTTQPHLRSEVKDEFTELRKKLSVDDQDLLILRVDRNLSWHDIVFAMSMPSEPSDQGWHTRREAALRQRFAEIKRRLRQLAEEAGLLNG